MQKHTVAVIGLGRMGSTIDDEGHGDVPYSVAAATRASERLELVAGADLLPDKRDAFQSRWGVAVYEDFRDMIDHEEPDLVAICTAACLPKPAREAPDASFRGDSHADLAVAVADMGVPMIYLEKAMASSMERADEIRDAVKRNNTLFNTGVLRRFDNRYDVVRDAVAAGQVGEVRAVIHYASSSLMHGHIHSIDTVSYLIGDPAIEAVRGELLPRGLQVQGNHIRPIPRPPINCALPTASRRGPFQRPRGNSRSSVRRGRFARATTGPAFYCASPAPCKDGKPCGRRCPSIR